LAVSLLVPTVVAAVVVVAMAFPSQMAGWMQAFPNQVGRASHLWPSLLPFLLIAMLVGTFLIVAPRLDRRRRVRFLSVIVLVDLAAFTVTSLFAVDGGQFWGTIPAAAKPAPVPRPGSATGAGTGTGTGIAGQADSIGRTGRFAIYDPLLVGGLPTLVAQPDLNIQAGQYSAQGYSAIVDSSYAAATGSHAAMGEGTNALTPAAIGNGVLDQLDTKTLFTPASYLITPITGPGEPPATTAITPPADPQAAHRTVASGSRASWFIGTPLPVTSVTVPALSPSSTPTSARIGLIEASGAVVWQTADVAPASGTLSARFGRPVRAVAVTVQPLVGPTTYGAPTISASSGQRFVADGQLQGADTLSHWTFEGTDGLFAVYANHRATPPLTLQVAGGSSLEGASVTRRTGPLLEPTSATVTSPSGVLVVRSMAAIPGWTATWQAASGRPAIVLPVRAVGIVQGVRVPPGTGTLTWSYQPEGAWVGLWLSVAGTAALLGLLAAWWARRRRWRPVAASPPE
jgi:hypothetical protein